MPLHSRWLVRLALVYLSMGVTVGTLLMIHKVEPLVDGLWRYRTLHIEFILIGFMLQLTFGVALWIMPRIAARRRSEQRERFSAVGPGIALNLGLWLSVWGALDSQAHVVTAGRILELLAVVLLIRHLWPRIRAIRKRE